MALNTKLMVPLALGFSLVTVTAFVVYYVFKEDKNEKEKNVKTTKFHMIEVEVPKSIVPALIGRNGSNIKQIEQKSGAMIHFKKFSDKEYDVCVIRGKSSTAQVAETLVHDFISQQPAILEDSFSVPVWAVGRIIGTGGENINNISHTSGARVRVEGQRGAAGEGALRLVTVRGTAEQIARARGMVDTCVEQEKCRREIEAAKRSPRGPQPSPPPDTDTQTGSRTHVNRESAGSSIEVYVSAVSSPSRFWVQLAGAQVAQLDDLVDHMTQYYGSRERREAHKLSHVSVGQVVAAVFRHDGRWYRARVHDIRPNEFDATQQVADVFFVDYGDSEYVATHELCELRADLLRLRFQAMECFLAGVKPVGAETSPAQPWPKWHPQAIERFEELTQVARWKALVSKTRSYRRAATAPGGGEHEIPGIELYDVTDAGTVDIGATLVAEGWAEESAERPPPHTPHSYGDLEHSRVLGMLEPRASSLPKDHSPGTPITPDISMNPALVSKSMASGLDNAVGQLVKSVVNFDINLPDKSKLKLNLNGSSDLIAAEKELPKTPVNELKANMNRIDSHHSLEGLARAHDHK
ncbi:tudor and KH domain-containing protein homolog isoform X3 [Aricia agestis]|uniref:tudor and KH domain-containing protein homolog isoform X3 n=1 Tax=Aricia agestis TaxID=91739 RepID=UPI001C20916C|nr:tudor and KH domain-containing protein homolog isoform X3 [Aricia agestis]